MDVFISFIIPAYNEANNIGATIKSIQAGKLPCNYEIIVVDHASIDNTAELALSLSATVVNKQGGSISSVRNYGVNHSKGNILVFLDADVTLTHQWFLHLNQVIEQLNQDPSIITGSHCSAPENKNWIENYWFNNYAHEINSTNLGTGHMILTRQLFLKIGGFNEALETGEDYAFCMEAIKLGGKVVNNPDLKVIHHDYPKNILKFIQREAWHGRSDAVSVNAILKSKVAIAAFLFSLLHVVLFIVLFSIGFSHALWFVPCAGIAGLVLLSAWKKFGHCKLNVILVNSVIFYFYFVGRTFSFVNLVRNGSSSK